MPSRQVHNSAWLFLAPTVRRFDKVGLLSHIETQSNMPLELQPAVDGDMYRAAVIEHEAYSPLESNSILFPGPFPPDVLNYRAEGWRKQAKGPGTSCFKVVDTDLTGEQQLIAFAQWYVPIMGFFARTSGLTRDVGLRMMPAIRFRPQQ